MSQGTENYRNIEKGFEWEFFFRFKKLSVQNPEKAQKCEDRQEVRKYNIKQNAKE